MINQTALRYIRISTNESVHNSSFVFPFFDRDWRVALVLVVAARQHLVLRDQVRRRRRGLSMTLEYVGARPVSLTEMAPDHFYRLYHFDPWWTMRGASAIPQETRRAIVANNLAGRSRGHLAVRDLAFDDVLEQVLQVRVGDGVFRPVAYHRDRPLPPSLEEALFHRAA